MSPETRKQLAALFADENPDLRRRAAEDLAGASGLAPIAALAVALEDDSKGVRDAAGRSLCSIGGKDAARAIVENIAAENIITRNLAAELLVKLGSIALPAVLPYLENANQDVRKFAVDIIGLIGDEEPATNLLPLLVDPDPNVVVSTVEALGNLRSARSLPLLYESYDRNEYTRAAVAEAVGKIGDASASGFLLDRLRQSLATVSTDPLTPFAIIEALGDLGGDGALAVLESVVMQVQGRLRSAVLLAIVKIAERHGRRLPALPGLKQDFLSALSDSDIPVRVSAVRWLSGFSGEEINLALARQLGCAPDLDYALAASLVERPGAFRSCVEVLPTLDPAQRKSVITLIGRLTLDAIQLVMRKGLGAFDESLFAQAFDAVAGEWSTADEETRAAIVDALFRLDGDRAVQFLDEIMNDPDPWLKIHVIEVIAAIADPRAPEFIARFLEDDDEMVREVAMGTLNARGIDPVTLSRGA
ncbi:MAG: HEAT repeat domain-containing protein [Bacteroidetes bacterium]|nr:HEAT repeat domain-containing protein [Bacteroidota bacterium]